MDGTGRDDEPDILPDVTADETGYGWGEDPYEPDRYQRLLDERPPHWDGPDR